MQLPQQLTLSLLFLFFFCSSFCFAQQQSLSSFIQSIVQDGSSLSSKFAKSASVCHVNGQCWHYLKFVRALELANSFKVNPSMLQPQYHDISKRMAWIQTPEIGEYSSNGCVLVKEEGEWKIMRLNITSYEILSAMQQEESKASLTVKVMSFNIRYGTANDGLNRWVNRDHLVFKVLEDHQPDLVGLQEALLFQIQEIVTAVSKYRWIGVGRDNGADAGEFSAILYDYNKFDVLEQGTFWYCDRPTVPGCISYGNNIPRICTWGRFRARDTGRTFFHYNTHLDHESANSREKSSQQLLDFILSKQSGEPVFITGDFNNPLETSPEISVLKNASFVDSFRVLYPNATNVGTFNGFAGTKTGTKIDFVFGSGSPNLGGPCKVEQASIIHDNENGRYPSDHFPVDGTLTFV